jgi:hypothetical protein
MAFRFALCYRSCPSDSDHNEANPIRFDVNGSKRGMNSGSDGNPTGCPAAPKRAAGQISGRDLVDPDHDPTKRSGSVFPPDMIEDSLHDTADILVPVNISLGLPQTPPVLLDGDQDALAHGCPCGLDLQFRQPAPHLPKRIGTRPSASSANPMKDSNGQTLHPVRST